MKPFVLLITNRVANCTTKASKTMVSLKSLLYNAAWDDTGNGWEAVKSKLQELEQEPENDEKFKYLEKLNFHVVMPLEILESLIRVVRRSRKGCINLLQKTCRDLKKFSFEHVRVAFENSSTDEVLETDKVVLEDQDDRIVSSNLILVLNNHSIWVHQSIWSDEEYAVMSLATHLKFLKIAHLLVTKCPALLHKESFEDAEWVGQHMERKLHPMSMLPKMVQAVVMECGDDADLATGYIRDYWFPIHSTWCDELGISDSTGDRFLRMIYDLVTARAYEHLHPDELLEFMCKREMWDLPARETARVWKGILKSGLLGESQVVLKWVAPMLGVTAECIVLAREWDRSTGAINALIQSNPGVLADAVFERKEPNKKRVKTE